MDDRAAAWLDASLRHRLWFAERDEHSGASLPFALCDRGDLTVVRNVSCGAIDGREIRLFDLEIWVEQDEAGSASGLGTIVAGLLDEADDGPEDHRLAERWECALVRAGAECGRLSVAPEGVLSRVADLLTIRDQDLELEAFNRRFEIQATDRRFANDFLDARMVAFLLQQSDGTLLETVGNRILVARRADEVPDVEALVAFAMGVVDRVPRAVLVLAPALPTADLTPGCPIDRDGRPRPEAFVASAEDDLAAFDPGGWAGTAPSDVSLGLDPAG